MEQEKYFILDLKEIVCYQRIINEYGEEVYEKRPYLEKNNYYLNHLLLGRDNEKPYLYTDYLTGIIVNIQIDKESQTILIEPSNITAPLSALKEITLEEKVKYAQTVEELHIGFELSLLTEEILIDGFLCEQENQKVIPASKIKQRKCEI